MHIRGPPTNKLNKQLTLKTSLIQGSLEVSCKVLIAVCLFHSLSKDTKFNIMKKLLFSILLFAFISVANLYGQEKLKYADDGLSKLNSISVMTWKKRVFGKTGKLTLTIYESHSPYRKLYEKTAKATKTDLLKIVENMLERGVIPIMTFWRGKREITMYLSADYFPNTTSE